MRNATTKNGKSQAQSVYGGANPRVKDVKFRNPKMYIKKSGDMSQKFALRSKQMAQDPIFKKAREGYTVDRYYGSDFYVKQYEQLEIQKWAIKHPNPPSSKGYIEPAPKGSELIKKAPVAELKRYPTTYKQEYLEPHTQTQYSDYAGAPLKYTPIGQL